MFMCVCTSLFDEKKCVCAINQGKTEADPEKLIFKKALLSICLYPVLSFPQRTQDMDFTPNSHEASVPKIHATTHSVLSNLPSSSN